MNELERVREQIAVMLFRQSAKWDDIAWEDIKHIYLVDADEILSLKGIRIECDKPTLPYSDESTSYDLSLEQIRIVKQMLKPDSEGNHWVKVGPKEKYEKA